MLGDEMLYCDKYLTQSCNLPDTLQNRVGDAMKFQFDKMISAPCRLSILATLVPGELVSFSELKAATSLSDGNLHAQTRKLDEAGYIKISKIMKGKRSLTEFRITELGRERLRRHIMKLQKILDADTGAKRPVQRARRPDDSAVWA
jgi:DNA-binding MarR family transcriptional regulator